jgi:hypothetical protein
MSTQMETPDLQAGEVVVWSVPNFVKNFEATRFQQGNDAFFKAIVAGKPEPEVAWTKKGNNLPSSEKYEWNYDAKSGQVSLMIRNLGPGDEGQYSCTVNNDYGSVTATLNVNPDINAMKTGPLSPGCLRASLQRKQVLKHQNQQEHQHLSRSESGMTL